MVDFFFLILCVCVCDLKYIAIYLNDKLKLIITKSYASAMVTMMKMAKIIFKKQISFFLKKNDKFNNGTMCVCVYVCVYIVGDDC